MNRDRDSDRTVAVFPNLNCHSERSEEATWTSRTPPRDLTGFLAALRMAKAEEDELRNFPGFPAGKKFGAASLAARGESRPQIGNGGLRRVANAI